MRREPAGHPLARAPFRAPIPVPGWHIRGILEGAWRSYWRRRAECATLFMLQSLDDRTLKDIGIDRSEIGSVVYGGGERRICVGWVER